MPVGVDDRILRTGPVNLNSAFRNFGDDPGQPTRNRSERGFYFGSSTYVPPSTGEGTQPGVLAWSASQGAQVTTLESMGFQVNWPSDRSNTFFELSRTTQTKRVENPDDSTQYVDVEVATGITYRNAQNTVFNYSFGG